MQTSEQQAGTQHILVERVDGVGHIRLNRTDARNALSPQMKDELIQTTLEFERDPDVRAVLISATGPDFMVGADLKRFKTELDGDRTHHSQTFEQRVVKFNHYFQHLHRMPKPVILAAHGHTVGVGFCMAAVADFVIAADDAKFMLAYRHIALSPDAGITWALPRIVGERRAKEIVMLGETIDAQKALDWGIANWVVPRATLEEEAMKTAKRLARGPTIALARGKKLVGEAFDTNWDAQLNREAEYIAECVGTQDHYEGVSAFLDKRKPSYKGS